MDTSVDNGPIHVINSLDSIDEVAVMENSQLRESVVGLASKSSSVVVESNSVGMSLSTSGSLDRGIHVDTEVSSDEMEMTSKSNSEALDNLTSNSKIERRSSSGVSERLGSSSVSCEGNGIDEVARSSSDRDDVFSLSEDEVRVDKSGIVFASHSGSSRYIVVEGLESNNEVRPPDSDGCELLGVLADGGKLVFILVLDGIGVVLAGFEIGIRGSSSHEKDLLKIM